MAELSFEYLALALEATRGTAVTPPTHYLPLSGMIVPTQEFYRPEESRGTLAEFYRAKAVRQGATWSGEGGADPNYAPLLFNMAVKAVTAPTQPDAINSPTVYLWTFAPTMTSDDLKTATVFWGDPNEQIFRSTYSTVDSLSIEADASGTDGVTWSVEGSGQWPTQVAAPTMPAQAVGELLMPGNMQVWLDTSSAIGTTALSDRVVSANFNLTNNLSYKRLATGPGGSLSFSRIGRGKRHAESTVVLDLADTTEYDIFEAGTVVKLRVRVNGPIIEDAFYYYIQWDIYGPMDSFSWGDLEGTNRTMEFTVMSQYDTTAGHDWRLLVQNDQASLTPS